MTLQTLAEYQWTWLPPVVGFDKGLGSSLVLGLKIFGAASLAYLLLTLLASRLARERRRKISTYLQTFYYLIVFLAAIHEAEKADAIPFVPFHIIFAFVLLLAGILVMIGASWYRLNDQVRPLVPRFEYFKVQTWLNALILGYILVPFILFKMPLFNHEQKLIYCGTPLVLLALYLVLLLVIIPQLLFRLNILVPVEALPDDSRQKFLWASEPINALPGTKLHIANGGLLNALAMPSDKRIIVGRNLIATMSAEELRGILLHEQGHLLDRVNMPKISRNYYLGALCMFLSEAIGGARLGDAYLLSPVLLLIGVYFLVFSLRKVRLRGEAFADRYVKETDPESYAHLLTGLEKLYALNGLDPDHCKKNNAAHLDADERQEAVASGTLPKRKVRSRAFVSVLVWMVIGICGSFAYQHFFPGAEEQWRQLHNDYHRLQWEDPAAAQAAIEQALAVAEQEFAPHHPKTYRTLNDLAQFFVVCADYDRAQDYAQRTLEMGAMLYGENDLRVTDGWYTMGRLLLQQEDVHGALKMFAQILELQVRLGGDKQDQVTTLVWMVECHQQLEQSAAVVDDYQRMLQLLSAIGSEGESRQLDTLSRLSEYLGEVGSYRQAEEYAARAVTFARDKFGVKSDEYAYALTSQATLKADQQFYAEAATLINEALAYQVEVYGAESPDAVYFQFELANVYRRAGRYQEEETLLLAILALQEQQQQSTLRAIWTLGELYAEMQRWADAEAYLVKAAEAADDEADDYYVDRFEILDELQSVFEAQGKVDAAREITLKREALCRNLNGSTSVM